MSCYAIAIGSNRRGRHGSPEREVRAAVVELGQVVALSPILPTPPLGPSRRRFANTVALIESAEEPPALLRRLKQIEQSFGRRRGQTWGARVLDLDIILWSGGVWSSPELSVPHAHFRNRSFVLVPLLNVAAEWRDPLTHLSVRQLVTRLTRPHACA